MTTHIVLLEQTPWVGIGAKSGDKCGLPRPVRLRHLPVNYMERIDETD